MSNEQDDLADIERHLGSITPRPAPERLRHSVLTAVSCELSASRRPRHWDRRLALVAIVMLIAGVVLNAIVLRSGETRMANLLETDATPRTIGRYTAFIESVTDRATARRVEQQLLAMTNMRQAQPSRDEHLRQVQQFLNEWALTGGDWINAQILEDPQMDQHRSRDDFRGALDDRRNPYLASELTT